jgi:hypothetical protein
MHPRTPFSYATMLAVAENSSVLVISRTCPVLPFYSHCSLLDRKHSKTHTRRWKCSDPTCKYHELGWPTQNDKDRHENDKHSKTPAYFKCNYPECVYQSKRETNCKQHMEKAHGWTYVRSRNYRKKSKNSSGTFTRQKPTPQPGEVPGGSSAVRLHKNMENDGEAAERQLLQTLEDSLNLFPEEASQRLSGIQ